MDSLRQAFNVMFAVTMPITTYFTFSRGTTVEESILSSPNDPPIVPAGYTFSIWGLIYASSFVYAIYQALPAQSRNHLLRRIGFATGACRHLGNDMVQDDPESARTSKRLTQKQRMMNQHWDSRVCRNSAALPRNGSYRTVRRRWTGCLNAESAN